MTGKNRFAKQVIIIIACLFCVAVFIALFANGQNTPSWNDVLRAVNLSPESRRPDDFVRITDVGQGDSILICSNGKTAMVDTGPPESANSILRDLKALNTGRIEVVMQTHLHADHIGGLESVLDKYGVINLILPELFEYYEGVGAVRTSMAAVTESGGGVYTAKQGMYMNVGEFIITVLCQYNDLSDINDRSIVAMAEIDGIKFLLTGDAKAACENRLLDSGINLDCDVLKVGHHGSGTSSSERFIKAASPKYAAISVGKGNSYSHPASKTLETLSKYGAQVFRTDTDGDITFYVENRNITVELENFK